MGLTTAYFGVRLWIWLYLVFTIFLVSGAGLYFYRERLKKTWFKVRHPERLIRVVIHYSSNQFREFWRIIPETDSFKIRGQLYHYKDEDVQKNHDFYLKGTDTKRPYVEIMGVKYTYNEAFGIKERKSNVMTIHYWYNNPSAIIFKTSKKELSFNSTHLAQFKANDLWVKLLTLTTQQRLLIFIIMATLLNMLLTGFLVAEKFGLINIQ